MRERPTLASFTADAPYFQAILDVLGDIHDLLDERLPAPTSYAIVEPQRIAEPAPARAPVEAVPVSEPAPDVTPTVDDEEEDGGPVKVTEPAPQPTPPPRRGRGSSLDAWEQFADDNDVSYPAGSGRDDIIAACERAGVITSE